MEIKGVKIGDVFKYGKNLTGEVIDFIELRSMVKNEVIGYKCWVKSISGVSVSTFEMPFATIIRYKLSNKL